MVGGDAFPSAADLAEAAEALDVAAARLSSRVRAFRNKARRKAARDLLKRTWFAVESLRSADPGGQEGRLAMRRARELELALAEALGDDPHADLGVMAPRRPGLATGTTGTPLPDPLRLDWPIRYDLDRFERLGGPGRAADAVGRRLDDVAAEIEARALAASPDASAPRTAEPVVDMDVAELAKGRGKGGGQPP